MRGSSWQEHLVDKFIDEIKAYTDAFKDRILPTFDSIDTEAEDRMNELYRTAGQMPFDGSADMADMAEWAHWEGVEYYQTLRGISQSIVTLSLIGLRHLVEQQTMLFLKQVLLNPQEQDDHRLFKYEEFACRLESRGVDLATLSVWPELEELRHISNAAKHAEGNSAEELRSLRPDLFRDPQLDDFDLFGESEHAIFSPLSGEDLYPTTGDLVRYSQACAAFWAELILVFDE
jgi:hypothetical protein